MEVLLGRRCCVRCNTEAATPPQAWATWRWSTTLKTFNFDLLYFYNMPHTCPNYLFLPTLVFDVGSGRSVDHASGGVGGVLASFNTMVKECCGSSFLIIPPWI